MCGIAGIISQGNSKNYEPNLSKMLVSIKHRGPDETGIYFFKNVALGHVRLSIIDIKTGQQPMLNQTKNSGIVFNGEIYGYKNIKKQQFQNHNFSTTSDTELILALYEKYSTDLLEKLPGIFSFALWDENNKKLFCARDRFGEKPFFYAWGENNTFVFASEIKAIINSGLIKPKLNFNAVTHYLQKLYVSPTQTIYSNIHTLPPAHCLTYENNQIKIERYWKLPTLNPQISFDEALCNFKLLFEKSIDNQLIADVPVSAFLSGGLDSSTVVALASKINKDLTVFSFGFDKDTDETKFAKKTAEKYNLNLIELQAKNFKLDELILKMNNIYDEPFADSSNIPTYLISKLASKYTKVALTGDGGDELLGGYSFWYNILVNFKKHQNKNYYWENMFYKFLYKAFHKIRLKRIADKFNNTIKPTYIHKSVFDFHQNQNIWFTDQQIRQLLKSNFQNSDFKYAFNLTGNVSDAFNMDILNYMPGDILVKTDRASMANGLELRAPFLDVDFASFCISLPDNLKISEKQTKIILRKAYENKWINEIKKIPKQGFGAPVHKWLKIKEVSLLKKKYLNDKNKKIFEILNIDEVQKYVELDNYKTWILLVLSIWLEKNEFDF